MAENNNTATEANSELSNLLYGMKCGETLNVGETLDYIRVPGGWIYERAVRVEGGYTISSCFVPFNNEFM